MKYKANENGDIESNGTVYSIDHAIATMNRLSSERDGFYDETIKNEVMLKILKRDLERYQGDATRYRRMLKGVVADL